MLKEPENGATLAPGPVPLLLVTLPDADRPAVPPNGIDELTPNPAVLNEGVELAEPKVGTELKRLLEPEPKPGPEGEPNENGVLAGADADAVVEAALVPLLVLLVLLSVNGLLAPKPAPKVVLPLVLLPNTG
jgi:hypothetical protein